MIFNSKIEVLFIYPPVRLSDPPRYPPYGLMSLAAVLEKNGIKVEILDLNLLRLQFDDVMQEIGRRGFDVIGIGGMSTVYYYIKLISLHLKQTYTHIPIIGGGSACSASPRVVLEKTGVDVVCMGEGEPIIVDLVCKLVRKQDMSKIPGIYYKDKSGKIYRTSKRPRMINLGGLPFPSYHLVDMDQYISNNRVKYKTTPIVDDRVRALGIDPEKANRPIGLFTKRGCPFVCNFCYRNFGRKVVYIPVDYTLKHMSFLEKEYNTAHFVFADEIFNVSKKWVLEFCEQVIAEDRRYILSTANSLRANVIDREMLEAMRRAGFCRVGIGIESFYDPTLKMMNKGQKAKQVHAALKLAKEIGFQIGSAQFLFGYETDGKQSMDVNVEALTDLGIYSAGFSIPCPYPGTYLYDVARERGLITDEEAWLLELADKDISDRVINMSKMSDKELFDTIQYGKDKLRVNSIRLRSPFAARIFNAVQPALRKWLKMDALGLTLSVALAVRSLLFYRKLPNIKTRVRSGVNGDEYILEEALELLNQRSQGKSMFSSK